MRGHVDLALNRGRCGLWNWDLAQGRVAWSKSMFEMLGLPPRAGQLSLAELQAMCHPDDEPLAAIAARAQEAKPSSVDFELRMRNCRRRMDLAAQARRAGRRRDDRRAAARRHRGRRHRPEARGRAVGDRRPAAARSDRGDLGSVRPVGLVEPPGAVQLEIPAAAQPAAGSGEGRRAIRRIGRARRAAARRPGDRGRARRRDASRGRRAHLRGAPLRRPLAASQ